MLSERIALFVGPVLACVFLFCVNMGLSQSLESANDAGDSETLSAESGAGNGFEGVFSEGDQNAVYINWEISATNGSSCAWFLGAYRIVSGYGSNGVTEYRCVGEKSLCVDLDRSVLRSNDLYYALNCFFGSAEDRAGASLSSASHDRSAALFCNLLTTNGIILVESENLMSLTNAIWYADGTNTVLFFEVPTAKYPDAAVIQLRVSGSDVGRALAASPFSSDQAVIIRESLLFADTAFDLWVSSAQSNGATNYADNSLSNFYDRVNGNGGNSSTNNSGGGGGGNGGDNDGDDRDENSKIIYVDQKNGNDSYSGRSSSAGKAGSPQARPPCANTNSKLEGEAVASRSGSTAVQKGPKKTIRAGFGIAKPGDTIVIRSGNYNENLNISGKNMKVIIAGNVKL